MKTKAILIVEEREKVKLDNTIKVGDTVRIEYFRLNAKDKKDKFTFEGIVTALNYKTIRVFKPDKDSALNMTAVFPINSPNIKIHLVSRTTRRQRAKAYYLETLTRRNIKLKNRNT